MTVIQNAQARVRGVMSVAAASMEQAFVTAFLRPGSRQVAARPMRETENATSAADPAELIAAIALRKDRRAFAMLFEQYAGRVKGWNMRMGASPEFAEDIVQETMLAVWRKAETYDSTRASASAWLFAIARNQRIDRLRRDKRARDNLMHEMELPDEPEQPDDLVDAAERGARVRDALAGLPDEQARVVQLSFFEGHAHAEIAERLGIPLGTVKSRLRLAMTRLRSALGELR